MATKLGVVFFLSIVKFLSSHDGKKKNLIINGMLGMERKNLIINRMLGMERKKKLDNQPHARDGKKKNTC